jgi:hypothetical protein
MAAMAIFPEVQKKGSAEIDQETSGRNIFIYRSQKLGGSVTTKFHLLGQCWGGVIYYKCRIGYV